MFAAIKTFSLRSLPLPGDVEARTLFAKAWYLSGGSEYEGWNIPWKNDIKRKIRVEVKIVLADVRQIQFRFRSECVESGVFKARKKR